MKRIFQVTWYLIPGLLLAATAIGLGFLPGYTYNETTLARDIPGVNAPVVTARLVETRTTRTEIALPVVEIPVAPPRIVETPQENTATFYFQPPDDPVVEAPPAVNLVVLPDATYRLEPLKEQQPGRLTLVH